MTGGLSPWLGGFLSHGGTPKSSSRHDHDWVLKHMVLIGFRDPLWLKKTSNIDMQSWSGFWLGIPPPLSKETTNSSSQILQVIPILGHGFRRSFWLHLGKLWFQFWITLVYCTSSFYFYVVYSFFSNQYISVWWFTSMTCVTVFHNICAAQGGGGSFRIGNL